MDKLLTRNVIWCQRNQDVGPISAKDAIDMGLSGPNLRAAGVEWDIRKAYPYLGYDRYDFEIPVGEHGDCYDRYLVRMEEMRQSIRIIEQALKEYDSSLPLFPQDPQSQKVFLPHKDQVLTKMEELIDQFIVATEGPRPSGARRSTSPSRRPRASWASTSWVRVRTWRTAVISGALLRESSGHAAHGGGPDGRRRGGHHRVPGPRSRRSRPMSYQTVAEMLESPEFQARIEATVQTFPEKRTALLLALHQCQSELRFVPLEFQAFIAEKLGMAPAHVRGVVTFYEMFTEKQLGRHLLQVCKTLPCMLTGSEILLEHLQSKLEVSRRGRRRETESLPSSPWNAGRVATADPPPHDQRNPAPVYLPQTPTGFSRSWSDDEFGIRNSEFGIRAIGWLRSSSS